MTFPLDTSVDGDSPTHGGSEGGNLGEMLLNAETERRKLETELVESQADVAALRKQLMKAMKDAAKPGSGPSISG